MLTRSAEVERALGDLTMTLNRLVEDARKIRQTYTGGKLDKDDLKITYELIDKVTAAIKLLAPTTRKQSKEDV